jgi:X-Pro dipeptidyl-peptidase
MLRRGIVCAVLALCAWAAPAAALPPVVLGPDGTTAPIHDYEQAVRERVYIPQPGIDQDGVDGDDWIAIEIMRPPGSGPGLEVPAIVDASPYYTTSCRGNEGECIGDVDGDGRNDRWPLFYDNYFVPRGYAYVLAEMNGTGNSTGCPMHGGPGDIAGMKSVVDWLAGRIAGYPSKTTLQTPVHATWSRGSVALIGKSYDGTLANGVAATGVEGLKTIVPISAISNWYRYSRQSGIRFNTNYPAGLAQLVTNSDRVSLCAASRTAMNGQDGDETGDMNPFWDQRNHLTEIRNVKASVFAVHGFQDDNVKLDHLGPWWDGLKEREVPRKLWLLRGGHVDPFDSRRAVWVDTLHRWFDHWLLGVDNGIMDAPQVTVEEAKDTWQDYADWPLPGSVATPVYLRGTSASTAGALELRSGGDVDTLSFANNPGGNENTLISAPEGAQTARRVFLSAPLQADLRISGTPVVDIRAALSTTQSNLGAVLVDYGPGAQTTRNAEGILTDPVTSTDCWGASTTRQHNGSVVDHSACYRTVSKPVIDVTQWRITRGILDSANRNSLTSIEPVTIDAQTRFSWPLVPDEHVVPKDHRLGIVLVGNYPALGTAGTTPSTITLDTKASKLLLPVVGGYRALAATRAFGTDATAPEMTGVPADLVVDVADPTGTIVTYPLPTATDDETPDPQVVCAPASGTRFPIGATKVTCTATDAYDNATIRAFTVTVVDTSPDTTPPQLHGLPQDIVAEADDAGGAMVPYTLPTATDAVTDTPLVVCDPAPGTKFPIGATTITCTATDDAGNASAKTFVVTVKPLPDTAPPVLTGMPADIVVASEDGDAGAILVYALPTATDDRTAHPHVTCDPAPGSRVAVGAHTVKCTATDESGNAATSAFTATVVGKGSPPPVKDPGGAGPGTGDVDVTAPGLRGLRVQLVRRALRVRVTLGEDATLRVVVARKGAKRAFKVKTIRARAGKLTLRLGKVPKGRYTVTVVATDAAGNKGPAVAKRFKRR